MKNIYTIALGLLMAGTLAQSCKKEMQEINTDPNQLNETRPEFLFTSATLNYSLPGRSQLMNKYRTTLRYMQYIVSDNVDKADMEQPYCDDQKTTFPDPGSSGALYFDFYNSIGRDCARLLDQINAIKEEGRRSTYRELAAICRIMFTYDAWKVMDIYGAMPYSQAFNVTAFPLPVYDYNWQAYQVFDKQLRDAADVLRAKYTGQVNLSKQDFFYNGNMENWLRFTNTLRIKIAQRFEKRNPAHLQAVLQDIATNYQSMIIANNAGSFGYSNVQDWNNNVDDLDQIQNVYVAAYPFVTFLKSTRDPRLPLMVRRNDWGDNYQAYKDIQEKGIPESKALLNDPLVNSSRYWGKHVFSASNGAAYGWEGQPKTKQFTIKDGDKTASRTLSFISLIQTRLFVKNGGFKANNPTLHKDETVVDGNTIKMRTSLLNYAETCFMMAEIAAKGGNGFGKSAAAWYEAGVTASFDYYKALGISQNTPGAADAQLGDFLTRYPYNGLTSVYSQAWVNFLTEPEEAWAMWKRTGYPQQETFNPAGPNKIGDGSGIAYLETLYTGSQYLKIPRRAVLQITSTQMGPNLDKAIDDMKAKDPDYGVDRLDTRGRIWWDMK
ncbi:SusD/RagB family nutrient-binding outer membrane lipoprotein [Chitinophaga nivalis]|uniref:SusD/RagB family nutrient-binding outer membrane lipoprotein n=1 Tax=Chitinophaga nivalis TaxID=2991709 RepID=A0ABT3ISC5_9BACT|nr:SusD/RagB family nutrient-binding outer membrane lipoprotein [Chitinophaga nivalis]MCW3463436.1 SusD/RagB family nutrient-binding outer membrane lipoprotein [Chitinophaga nivalis]MCW3486874.1 SusD/RagB family nutrient-binding outer membrane lipoprotein [Chitinophaga nivalis]